MVKTVDFYYFSPTGGTKKAGAALADGIALKVNEINLADKSVNNPFSDAVIFAVPVFSGRIPALVREKIAQLNGEGKKAVTAVVYGVRAYEDALLELNDTLKSSGFEVIACAALVARHSIVPEVGAGRPDKADIEEIQRFAKEVVQIIDGEKNNTVDVPGNRPYKQVGKNSAVPISLDGCNGCGCCVGVCPTEAVTLNAAGVVTDADKCIMCMACVAGCPEKSRALPLALQEGLTQKLSVFKDVRRGNEFYI